MHTQLRRGESRATLPVCSPPPFFLLFPRTYSRRIKENANKKYAIYDHRLSLNYRKLFKVPTMVND